MNLFDIDREIEAVIQHSVDPETGEILDDQFFDNMNALQCAREKKIENAALFIKERRALASAITGEIKALQARKKSAEREADSTERYLAAFLHSEKFTTPRVSISWRQSQSVVCDITKLPKKFLRFKEPEANKAEISKVLKAGGKVKGAELVTNTSIVLK